MPQGGIAGPPALVPPEIAWIKAARLIFSDGHRSDSAIMRSSPSRDARWRTAGVGALLCAALGLLSGLLRWGDALVLQSYDLPFAFQHAAAPNDVSIVYLDEKSYDALSASPRDFDRAHYARLLEYLKKDGARLVVFDISFRQPDPARPASDRAFAQAIRAHGNVVLLGETEEEQGTRRFPPWDGFKTNAVGWGISPVKHDLQIVVRQYDWRTASDFALPWIAANQIQPGLPPVDEYAQIERWLNYYGPPDTLDRISFIEATNRPFGYFANRCVFIGSRTTSQYAREHPDQFRTPYTQWVSRYSTGVEIVATAFLNLLRNESLRCLPAGLEILLILLLGALAGFALAFLRPLPGAVVAFVSGAGLAAIAIALVQPTRVWFPWTIPVVVQIPCAWAWSAWSRMRNSITTAITAQSAAPATPANKIARVETARVADHDLLRRIGQGAYGEVWLARNTVGMFQAVKIVQRGKFEHPGPYEREFRGIEKFMPISRSHPGFVHILHVGRDDQEGRFYYMMELADDVIAGRAFAPETYVARTLASILRQQGPRPVHECVELGLSLSAALEQLHQNNLVHRDIKPANILFVNGAPKFGDIGLVTAVEGEQGRPSFVGTPGFVPPEGPGAPSADVYGLGKLLYEAAVGCDAERFPELPTEMGGRSDDDDDFARFQEILWRACEPNIQRRFESAAAFHSELLKLKSRMTAAKP
jgi:CHASE2 domain-containing sensor protein